MISYFTTWTLIRTSGFLAYYLLTLSLCLGLLGNLSVTKKKKGLFITLHQASGWYGLLAIVFHMMLLWQDEFVPYSIAGLLVPFFAQNEPIYSALGTFAFYLFFLVIGSSDFFMRNLGIRKWRKLHYAVLPAWVMIMIHGTALGTDTKEPWAFGLYIAGSAALIFLSTIRYIDAHQIKRSDLDKKTTNLNGHKIK
ncbi:ferric reductase-like transmembrane domain-containing protein [Neobacillus dielmonensis]|uniref:ferric reductase-like transmembrane domain-containing protein n=1 Tax=Neobacillus dielmonensis TaxID=1347369 RepID=UPI00069474A3|nr:ferric reductase-like transmembrane domain-containing protein [Neobacillus dielmonensis]